MTRPSVSSVLLASTDPVRLRDWYAAGLDPGDGTDIDGYLILRFGGFHLMIDRRADVGDRTPEPGHAPQLPGRGHRRGRGRAGPAGGAVRAVRGDAGRREGDHAGRRAADRVVHRPGRQRAVRVAGGLMAHAEVNGLALHYEVRGTGDPLGLLRGGVGAIEVFGPVLPALAQGRQRIAV